MFWEIIIKTAIVHTLTYFIVGFAAFTIFNYSATLSHAKTNMRPATDLRVRAGVLFQPIRGVLFGIILFLLRDILIAQSNGWLITWLMFVIVGILGTFAPAASSLEGLIYLKPGIGTNWGGLIEILTQSFYCRGETWNFVKKFKNPVIDFKRLQKLTTAKTKQFTPEYF